MRKLLSKKLLVLVLAAFSFSASFAQNRTINGTVADESGKPLFGATVLVKNSSVSTTTDPAGNFSLKIPATAKELVISFVGMKSQEISIGDRTNIPVILAVSANSLTDVVVIGYGKASKVNLTTAQTSVSEKQINETVNTTVEQAIQGRAAGVYVTQNSGQPGGGISVNIRGVSSLNRTQPLYVIDGVQIQASEDVS